ncbi:MAG: hypothetical protein HEP71_30155 [Roseivirga sp.]|nr:hypothetical protein [Roseivirga sp.]
MVQISTPIFEKIKSLLGFALANQLTNHLIQSEIDVEDKLSVILQLADHELTAATEVKKDETGAIEQLNLKLQAETLPLALSGWPGVSFQIITLQLGLKKEEVDGAMKLNLLIGDFKFTCHGKVLLTESGYVWKLDFDTNTHFLALFQGYKTIHMSLSGLCDLLHIDKNQGLRAGLLLSDKTLQLDFPLPLKPVSLIGELKLESPVLSLGISTAQNSSENHMKMAFSGELTLGDSKLGNGNIEVSKYPESYRLDLGIEAIQKRKLAHLINDQDSFDHALNLLPQNLKSSLLNGSWLSSLKGSLYLSKARQSFTLSTGGAFIGFEGNTTFSLDHTGRNALLGFDLSLDETSPQQSLNQLLNENFGLISKPVDGPLGRVLDNLRLKLDQVRFSQSEQNFVSKGNCSLGDSSFNCSSLLTWSDKGFSTSFSLEKASKGPGLSPKSILDALSVDLQSMTLPGCEKLVDNVTSTSLDRLNLVIDSQTRSLEIEASFLLFSKIETLLNLKLDLQKKELSFSLSCNEPLSLKELLEACAIDTPEELPSMELHLKKLTFNSKGQLNVNCSTSLDVKSVGTLDLDRVDLKIDVPEKTYSFEVKSSLEIAPGYFPLAIHSEAHISLKKEESVSLKLTGDFKINELPFNYDIDLSKGEQSFKASTQGITLDRALKTFSNIELPAGLPNPSLDLLSFEYIRNKSVSIKGQVSNKDALSIPGSDIQMSKLGFSFQKLSDQTIPDISLNTNFELNLFDTLKIDNGSFDFELTEKAGKPIWKLENSMDMHFFDHTLGLRSSYCYGNNTQTIDFEVIGFPKVEFIEGISLETKSVNLSLEKVNGNGLSLFLSTESSFISPLISIEDGKLSLRKNDELVQLKFESDKTLELPIAELAELPKCSLSKPEFHIQHKSGKGWSSGGSASIQFSNVPEVVSQIFPADTLTASFEFGSTENHMMVSFTEKDGKPWELYTIPLPPQPENSQGHEEIDLGNLYLGANDFKVDFKESELSANVYLGLPEKLNEVFKKEDGSKMEIFRTSKSADPKEAIRFKLAMGGKDLSIQMLDSPLKAFEMDEGKLIVDMKVNNEIDFGAFSLLAPKFKFDSGYLVAMGGIKLEKRYGVKDGEPDRELGIPTTLVKWFLRKINLGELADKLTPKVPFRGINYAPIKDGHRTFDSTALLDLFIQDKHSIDIPDWLRKPIELIDDAGGKLPDTLLSYGDFEVPEYFSFSLEFSAPSNLKFDISFKDPEDEKNAKPLKLLIPQFPQLMGIKLYSLGFGELWSGTLFHVDIDCAFDNFDIPRMMAAIAVDETWNDSQNYLPSPKDLHQSFRVKNLTTLIVYQTEIPIPIPLFYDEISSSNIVFEGMESESFLSFKKPTFGTAQLKALSALTTELVKFFKAPTTYKIQWNRMSDGDLTTLIVGPNYWQYPRYIAKELTDDGNDYKGLKLGHSKFEIGAIKILTALMSAIQNGSINELIQTRDLSDRHDHKIIKVLEVLDVDLKYALTTPAEFTSGDDSVRAQWKETGLFEQAKPNEFLNMLPPRRSEVKATEDGENITIPVGEKTEGLVTFFDGKMKLGEYFDSQTSLGVIASDAGFGLGGQFDLNIGNNIVNALMSGHAVVSKTGFELTGHSYFKMLDIEFFSGSFHFNKDSFHIATKTGVTPNPLFYVDGRLEGRFNSEEFYLEGKNNITLFGFSSQGDVLFDFTPGKRLFKLDHNRSLFDNFVSLKSSLQYSGDSGKEVLMGNLGFNIGEALTLNASGEVQASSDQVRMNGDVSLGLLGVSTSAHGELNFKEGQFDYFAKIHLFRGLISGDLTGHVNNSSFHLGGDGIDFKVKEIVFSSTRLDIEKADNGSLKLGMKGFLLGSKFALNSAISGEELALDGKIDPVRWLGMGNNKYMITIHGGDKAPLQFNVHMTRDGLKSAWFKGYVSLLDISETLVMIHVKDGYWETDVTHSFNLGNFLSSKLNLNLKMREGHWVTGDGKLETGIRIFVPAVKFSFNVWIPFVGKRRVTTTLVPEISLGQLNIRHKLEFKIYLNSEIAEQRDNLTKAIADLEKEESAANIKLEKSQKTLQALKDAGGFGGHKKGVVHTYNEYKKSSALGSELRLLDELREKIILTVSQILKECYDSNLDRHKNYIDQTLDELVRVLDKIGYNQYEGRFLYQYFRSDLYDDIRKLLQSQGLRVILQYRNYNMAKPGGSDEKTGGQMRKKHAGDEFDLRLNYGHSRLYQGAHALVCHELSPFYKNYREALFTKKPINVPPVIELGSTPPPIVYNTEDIHERDVDLKLTYDGGFKISHKATKDVLSFRGDNEDTEQLQWRPGGNDRYKMYAQITTDNIPTGHYKIKSDYAHFVVRPGGNKSSYVGEIRKEAVGDLLEIKNYSAGTFEIREGDYCMVVPGNHDSVRRADFRKQTRANEGLTIRYDAGQKGHYISYGGYYLFANTDNGELQFRSDGHKTGFKLFREVESDAVFGAIDYIPQRISAHFQWLSNRMESRKKEGKKSYGLFNHGAIDEYKKAHADLGPIHYLEDKVMRDKHEVLKINEKMAELRGHLRRIQEQQNSSDLRFWMEFSTEFDYAGIGFKLGMIRINFKVAEYTNFNKCLEQIPGIVAANLRENALNIFSGKSLPDNTRHYASARLGVGGGAREPDFSKLNKQYQIGEAANKSDHSLDEFLNGME